MYVLLTKNNCSLCNISKRYIMKNNYNINIKKATDDEIEELRNNSIREFPVLMENEKILVSGIKVGHYLIENQNKFVLK